MHPSPERTDNNFTTTVDNLEGNHTAQCANVFGGHMNEAMKISEPIFSNMPTTDQTIFCAQDFHDDVHDMQAIPPRKSYDHVKNKELRKKLKNRESAQAARDRKKAKMVFLEKQVTELIERNRYLQSENIELRQRIHILETEPFQNMNRDDANPVRLQFHHDASGMQYAGQENNLMYPQANNLYEPYAPSPSSFPRDSFETGIETGITTPNANKFVPDLDRVHSINMGDPNRIVIDSNQRITNRDISSEIHPEDGSAFSRQIQYLVADSGNAYISKEISFPGECREATAKQDYGTRLAIQNYSSDEHGNGISHQVGFYKPDEPIVNRDMSVQVQKLSHGGTEFKGYTEHPHRYEEQNGLPFNDYAWKIHLANGGNSQETLAKIEKWDLHNKNGHLVHDFNLERVAEYQQCTGEMLPSKNANECYDYQEKAYCDSSGVDSMSSPGMSASSTAPSPDSADTISQNFARNMAVFKVH